jgi:hypothetical protein
MKRLNIIILVLMAVWVYGFVALTARADIYSWTDENGVNHFTNYAPPKHAKLLMKTPEIPYDEEADNQRRETDRLEIARQELAEREAFLLQEQQAAERRIAAANARADAALWEADQILQEAEAKAEDANYDRSNGYAYGYYPYYRYGYRPDYQHKRHYRKYVGKYYKKHPYKYRHGRPYKHDYRKRPKHHFNRRHSAAYSRGLSHRSRTALFRGRHGRF